MVKLRIFEIKDKTGRIIYLTKERWVHIQKHPEMSDQTGQIKETLRYPDKIMPFSYDAAVSFYYRYCKEKKQYLFISVKYLNGEGFVITSFYTDKIK